MSYGTIVSRIFLACCIKSRARASAEPSRAAWQELVNPSATIRRIRERLRRTQFWRRFNRYVIPCVLFDLSFELLGSFERIIELERLRNPEHLPQPLKNPKQNISVLACGIFADYL
jgi:hypothetical protein